MIKKLELLVLLDKRFVIKNITSSVPTKNKNISQKLSQQSVKYESLCKETHLQRQCSLDLVHDEG